MIPDLNRITDSEYLAGLDQRTLDELRSMRAECQSFENAASYVRRFAQARLDLVAARLRGDGAAPLSEAIAGTSHGGDSYARPPLDMEPSEIADQLLVALDQVAPGAATGDVGDADAEAVVDALTEFENTISNDRRRLHEIIDTLQAEVVRRYRSGEASVDALIPQS